MSRPSITQVEVKKIDSTDLGAMGMWMKGLSRFKGEIKRDAKCIDSLGKEKES